MIKSNSIRVWSIAKKEFIHIKRDGIFLLWLIAVPVLQILLFGFMINFDPKHLPTAVISSEDTSFTRSLLEGLKNTNYFNLTTVTDDTQQAHELLTSGKVLFIITIPPGFTRDLIRGQQPHVLIEADTSDPVSVENGLRAALELPSRIFERDLHGSLDYLAPTEAPIVFDVQAKYNPESIPQYNTVSGLITFLIFSISLTLTALSIDSEFERGTFETLLITPLNSVNIILGKMTPYFILGYLLFFLLLAIGYFIFSVPFRGSLPIYLGLLIPFSLSNLIAGVAISAVTKTQFAALGLANFYLIVAMLISGFLFPFSGIPYWAQYISEIIPLTHFLRITRNSMLKGAEFSTLWPDTWPIILFTAAISFMVLIFFRRTID